MPMSIRFSPEEEARLEALSTRTGRSKSFYVRQAVRTYLDEIEQAYWQDEAVRKWEQAGKPSRPAEELWEELGL
ncbi:MAG: TraY domain-containing protein [Corynebacterium variabile]|uniref:type II toxin-antitoxin system RelB family antitoxin n=1 Tax=Corynebacterium variabile TaxID=1727 RepID=UPI0028A16A85|nr:TraY domain-containing protein [Corynebacterium variabile]